MAKARAKRHYYENRERILNAGKARRATNIAITLYRSAKNRAKEQGIPFSIDLGDIIIPDCCPALRTKFKVGTNKPLPESPTLDQIIPGLGYVPGNIAVISFKANTIKSNATLAEIRGVLAYMMEGSGDPREIHSKPLPTPPP